MNLFKKIFCFLLLLSLICGLCFVVPSARVLDNARNAYMDNSLEDEEGISFKYFNPFISIAYAEDSSQSNDLVAIPIPLDEKGRKAKQENFTENSYSDSTIKVELVRGTYGDANYHIAYIDIADPSQLRTGLAGKLGSQRVIKTSDLAPKFNAVVAINGDFYTQTKSGFIVRQGEVYRKKASNNLDLLLIDDKGQFHILPHGAKDQVNSINDIQKEVTIVNAFAFGPALMIDGVMQIIPKNYQYAPFAKNPRAAIAQISQNKYALIVVDGRMENSKGLTLPEFAELARELKLTNCYNLDGGNSAALFFKDGLYSTKSKERERSISDIIYFCSAEID